jgi:hypothetical protein
MRTLFTIHAGEYLVGSEIERRFKKYRVWIPSKDIGIDLLVTGKNLKKTLSIQVKFSKDFHLALEPEFHEKLVSCGWFTLNASKIKKSPAAIWIFVLYNFHKGDMYYIIINPKELWRRYRQLNRKGKIIQSYFSVNSQGECWETRGLSKKEQIAVANGIYEEKARDFTSFLNNWKSLKLK